jgi:DNA topoisomerase I
VPRLRRADASEPGILRRKRGSGFEYLDAAGKRVDKGTLERIRELVIPPAWQEVWISPNPRARIQATGIDAAGRKQYRYHASFRATQERAKFEALLDFAKALPGLRSRAARHLRTGPYEREWSCALAVGLINKAWFRVGSDRHTRRSRTYGITTLTKRHVTVAGDEIEFCFRAKNRKLVRRTIRNAKLATGVGELLELQYGARLFRFMRDGELYPVTAPVLNEYLAEHMGNGFTAKDFRTWGGTLLAATELARHGPPEDERDATRTLAAVMRTVGAELGNTPAVARDSYVSPVVVRAYRAGRTIEDYRDTNGARPRNLTADERALVRLLKAEA